MWLTSQMQELWGMWSAVTCQLSQDNSTLQQLQPLNLLCILVYCGSSVVFPLNSLQYCCFLREVKEAKSNVGTW